MPRVNEVQKEPAVLLCMPDGKVIASGTHIDAALAQLGLSIKRPPMQPRRQRKAKPVQPQKVGPHALYIVDKHTNELIGGGEDIADCIIEMSYHATSLAEARERFELVTAPGNRRWQKRRVAVMNSGYYKGLELTTIHWTTLDDMLERDTVDDGMKATIKEYLHTLPEYTHRRDEQWTRQESNFLRDFTPSESLSKKSRPAWKTEEVAEREENEEAIAQELARRAKATAAIGHAAARL